MKSPITEPSKNQLKELSDLVARDPESQSLIDDLKKTIEEKDKTIEEKNRTIEKMGQEISVLRQIKGGFVDPPLPDSGQKPEYKFRTSDFELSALDHSHYLEFFDALQALTRIKTDAKTYLIHTALSVSIIYILLSSNLYRGTVFHFVGQVSTFVDYWNSCVANRADDPDRAKALRCEYNTLRTSDAFRYLRNSHTTEWWNPTEPCHSKSLQLKAIVIKDMLQILIDDYKERHR